MCGMKYWPRYADCIRKPALNAAPAARCAWILTTFRATTRCSIRQVFPQVESRDAYMSGKELMEQGFMAQLAFSESAAVFCIEEV